MLLRDDIYFVPSIHSKKGSIIADPTAGL
jgi:hypothetical protein